MSFAAVSGRYADPLLGLHLAADIQPATYGAIGYLMQACTTFGAARLGDRVNLEIDVLARYVARLMQGGNEGAPHEKGG